MKRNTPATHNVLFVYPALFHYRRGVFSQLDRDTSISSTFLGDMTPLDGIETIDDGDVRNLIRSTSKRLGPLYFQSRVLREVLLGKYNSVVFHADIRYITTWLAAILCRLRRKRCVFWTIGWHRPEGGLKRLVRLTFLRMAHHLLLYGQTAKNIGIDMGYPGHRMSVVGNSIETPTFAATAPLVTPSKTRGELRIGAVIRLNTWKRLDLLVEAASLLHKRGKNVHVMLVGEGPDRDRLIALARTLDVRLTILPPVYDRDNLAAYYKDLDMTVVPAAAGLTVIQSMFFGVPVISDNAIYDQMPEWEAIVPQTTGLHYQYNSVAGLADAVVKLEALIREDPVGVAQACRSEVANNWSSSSQANRVVDGILNGACNSD